MFLGSSHIQLAFFKSVIGVLKPQDFYLLTIHVFHVYTLIDRCNQAETTCDIHITLSQ